MRNIPTVPAPAEAAPHYLLLGRASRGESAPLAGIPLLGLPPHSLPFFGSFEKSTPHATHTTRDSPRHRTPLPAFASRLRVWCLICRFVCECHRAAYCCRCVSVVSSAAAVAVVSHLCCAVLEERVEKVSCDASSCAPGSRAGEPRFGLSSTTSTRPGGKCASSACGVGSAGVAFGFVGRLFLFGPVFARQPTEPG